MRDTWALCLLLSLPFAVVGQTWCNVAGGYTAKKFTACSTFQADAASCKTPCCQIDTNKCYHYQSAGQITCPTGKYYEALVSAGNYASSTNKTTACCVPKRPCSASGVTCLPGYKLKCSSNLIGAYCTTSATGGTYCNANCCEQDNTKCKFIGGIVCPTGYFQDTAKDNTTATSANKNSVCCTAQADCSSTTLAAACLAGFKKREPNYCTTSSMTQTTCTNCCEQDTTKCGGIAQVSCKYAFQYWDTSKKGATFTTANIDCCSMQATCGSYTCAAGYMSKATASGIYCTGGTTTCNQATCCDADTTRCGGIAQTTCSTPNHFWDSSKAGTVFANAATDCCSAKASCGGYSCTAGYKPTSLQGTVAYCAGDSSTCNVPTCCDADTTKCGGVTAVACATPITHFWDSAKAGTTFTTKNIDCCTAKATCVTGTCAAGNKKKEPNYCTSSAMTTSSCNVNCCEDDTSKCGGIAQVGCTATNSYWDNAKAGTTFTTGNQATDCCSAKANCGGHSCAAGYKSRSNAATIYCTQDSTSCTTGTCCELDTTKCGGITQAACTSSNSYWDTTKAGTIYTTATTDCCSPKATCTGHTCSTGYKLKTSPATIYCSKASSTCTNALCCAQDATKCGGITQLNCVDAAIHYWDAAKADSTFTTAAIDCCSAKATCCGYENSCNAGYKLKANADTIYCNGASSTCDTTTCCDVDATKCGTTAVSCSNPTTHYWDTSKVGTTVITTKNVDCCTAKAACYGTPTSVCLAGRKQKMVYCATSATTANSCDVNCCEADPTKCGATGTCASTTTHYWDTAKAGTTVTTKNIECCTARAACTATPTSVCQAGYKKKRLYCTSSVVSTSNCNTNCCEQDSMSCKFIGQISCAVGSYLDPSKEGTIASPTTKNTVCCTAKAACSAGTCEAGYKKKEFNYCSSSATSASSCNSGCCEQDTATCKFVGTITCAIGYYYDAAKDGTAATAADKNSVCCTAKASCAAGTCSPGKKKVCPVTGLYCTSSLTTPASCDANCCKTDTSKCGGITKYTCTNNNYYWDSAKANTDFTTAGRTAGTACCTLKASCIGYTCPSGYKSKTSLHAATIYCTGAANSCTTTTCCELDTCKCGGITPVTCTVSNNYWDAAKSNSLFTTASIDCCSTRALCTTYTCVGGYKAKVNTASIYCVGATSTCTQSTCCDPDTAKCGGTTQVACATANHYWDSAKAGNTFTTANINCCTARATCTGYVCAAGYKLKTSAGNIYCTGGSTSCNAVLCCETDATKCGGITQIACATPATQYWDTGKAGTGTTITTANVNCCSSKATCTGYNCPAGYKAKANPGALYCTAASNSCNQATCCDADTTKCGGVITCTNANQWHYWDTAKADTTFSVAGTNCCAAKATCTGYVCAAGYKLKFLATSVYCSSDLSSCDLATCCDVDHTKCGTTAVTCATPTTHYWDSAKAGTTFTTQNPPKKNVHCCTAMATCSSTSLASACSAGYKKKEISYCTSPQAVSTTNCNTNCCELDTTKCGGITAAVTCAAANNYWDTTKANVVFTTSSNTECCTPKANCGGYVCTGGYTSKTNAAAIYCCGAAATCTHALCCNVDTTKCGGTAQVSCASTNSYWDTAKAGTAFTAGNQATTCCTTRALCSTHTCAAGYKSKANAAAIFCTSNTASCITSTCCDPDTAKCGGTTQVACATANHYWDSAKAGATFTTANINCCTAKANCGSYTCAAGYKPKTGVQTIYCTNTLSTCSEAICCDFDCTKCGGIGFYGASTVTCTSANNYWDATKANDVYKVAATDCCTIKANCGGHTCVAGYKLKANAATIYCTSDSSSCNDATCCDADTAKCGGLNYCTSCNHYWDTAKAGTTFNALGTDCCSQKADCSGYSCQAGYKSKPNAATIYCTDLATSCNVGTCCDLDTTKCGGITPVNCATPTTHYWDSAKAGATFTTSNIHCCTAKAACSGTVLASACLTGYKKKEQYCSTSSMTPGSCNVHCCEQDATKCGGAPVQTCATPATQYWDPTKASDTFQTANADCCSARAVCSGYSCAAGYKLKTSAVSIYCTNLATSCNQGTCCDLDTTKCGGINSVQCNTPLTHYWDVAKAGTTFTTPNINCCTSKATCAGYSCLAAGYKSKSNAVSIRCTGAASSCDQGTCCDADTSKCGGITQVTCTTCNHFWDSAKSGTTFTTASSDCCSAKATCAGYSCAAGYKAKAIAASIYCTGASTTCDQTTCCDADTATCKFVGTPTCATGYYYDTAKDGTPATSTTMNSVCCTAKAVCAAAPVASACQGGYKKKEFNYCTSSAVSTANCNTNCCEQDATKCGGQVTKNCATPATHYWDTAKDGSTFTTANVDCCSSRAVCCGYACSSGYKSKANAASIYCTNVASSCDTHTCCDKDTTKCGGNTPVTCATPTTHFWDSAKAGTTFATKNVDCCTARTPCSAAPVASACLAGWKKKELYCSSSVVSTANCNTNCCEKDTTKCGGITPVNCATPTTHYWDSAKAGTSTTFTTANTDCCTAKAVCSVTTSSSCLVGYKKKSHYCSNSLTTAASCNANCCEQDATKCGGVAQVACASPTTHMWDTAKKGSTITTTKNVDCCSAKAACSYYPCPSGYSAILKYCTSAVVQVSDCNANCCEDDTTKCKGIGNIVCATGSYYDAAVSDGTAATSANKNTVCCTAKAQCTATGVSCSAGYKLKCADNLVGILCTSSSTNAASCNTNCCEKDTTKCGGITQGTCSSAASHYWDSAKAGTTFTTAGVDCCTAKALCSAAPVASACLPGKKKQEPNYCTSSVASTGTCNTNCCEKDATKCGGITAVSCATTTTHYWDTAKASTTFTTANVDCCTAKASCGGYICEAGYKSKSNAATIYCTDTATSCSKGTCCDPDTTKCGGITQVTCTLANHYWDTAKACIIFTAPNQATDCCTAKSTCTGYQCAAGYKLKASPASIYCTNVASSCDTNTCCDKDTTKCGGITQVGHFLACATPTTHYWDTAKDGTTFSTGNANTECCTAKATCVAGTCAAGRKKQEPNYCATSATDTTSCDATCCEADTTLCGGTTPATCATPNTHYWDTAKASFAFTTAATDCCTGRATCGGYNCAAGYKLKTTPTAIYCTGASTTCDSTLCCEKDVTTCGGTTQIACTSSNSYWDSAKAATIFTAGTQASACCTTKATCNVYSCGTAYTLKTNPSSIHCSSDSTSCNRATCCNAVATKCGGIAQVNQNCAVTTSYWDSAKADTTFTSGNQATECCTTKATCCGYPNCPAGKMLPVTADTVYCLGDSSTCNVATCCISDATKCGGVTQVACSSPTTHFWDSAKAGTTFTTKNVDCCTEKAACYATPVASACLAGRKKKMVYCASSATTAASCDTACCENDAATCKHIGGVSCATGYYQDTATDGTAATSTNKNTVCCTAKAACYSTPASTACNAGWKRKETYCTGITGSSAVSTGNCDASCCEVDATKCGQTAVACATPTSHYWDSSKATTTWASSKGVDCCTARALCSAGSCSSGYKKKEFNYCATSATTATSCDATCCENDASTCKHIGGVSCATGYYKDTAKDGTIVTSSSKNTDCCTAKAACTAGTCSTGWKKKCPLTGLFCSTPYDTTAAACNTACCQKDPTKCGGITQVTCANANSYWDHGKAGTTFTANNQATDCCSLQATCSGYSCAAGYKAKANVATIRCTDASTSCNLVTCCDADTTKCGTTAVTCLNANTHYGDSAKAGTTFTTKNVDCCTAKAVCSNTPASACNAGYKKKELHYCSGSAATAATCAACCEQDSTKCGGITPVACSNSNTHYWDSAKYGTTFTTGSQATDCCTMKATCVGYSCTGATKLVATPAQTYCTGASSSCNAGTCCVSDATRCGGTTQVACTNANFYWDTTKAAIAFSVANIDCCSAKATCAGYACAAGYSSKTNAASIYCAKGSTSCNANTCCDAITTQCGGTTQVTCAVASHYWDSTKASTIFTTKNIDCCTAKASCCGYACGAGFKSKVSVAAILCTGDSTTCTSSICCEADATKCGTTAVTCATPTTHYWDVAKAGTTFTTRNVDCCTGRAVCSTAPASVCSAGYKKKELYCSTSAVTAASCNTACCEQDSTKCGGIPLVPCANVNTHFWDPAKAGNTFTTGNQATDCCTAKAACSATPATACNIARKKKNQYCSTAAIDETSCNTPCCELDAGKCRGIGGISCSASHFVDTAKYGTAATSSNKNMVCCTARAVCPSPPTPPLPPQSPTPAPPVAPPPAPPSPSPTPPPSPTSTLPSTSTQTGQSTTTTTRSTTTSTTSATTGNITAPVSTSFVVLHSRPTPFMVIVTCLFTAILWR